MTDTSEPNTPGGNRKVRGVAPLSAIGMITLPILFVWFLQQQGQGTVARTPVVANTAAVARSEQGAKAEAAESPTPVPPTEVAADSRDLPLDESNALNIKDDAKPLSAAAMKMRSLYGELQTFRWEPQFHVLGFDACCRYAVWKGKVRLLNAQTGQQLLQEIGAPASELIQLADVYRRNEGDSDTYARWLERRLQAKLYPSQRSAGGGRVLRTSRGCVDFDKMTRGQRQMENGDIRGGEALLDEARCTELPSGETVGAPSHRRSYSFSDGSGQLVFLLVKRGSLSLWVPEDDLAFR